MIPPCLKCHNPRRVVETEDGLCSKCRAQQNAKGTGAGGWADSVGSGYELTVAGCCLDLEDMPGELARPYRADYLEDLEPLLLRPASYFRRLSRLPPKRGSN